MPKIQLEEFQMYYEQAGSGDPVVLIHGLGDGHEVWNHQTQALAEGGFEVFAVDLRGHGDSEKTDAKHTMERFAQDINAFMDSLGLPTAHIVGLSMGGFIAQILAVDFPERVRSLILIGTACELKVRFIDKLQIRLAAVLPYKPFVKQYAKRPFWQQEKEWIEEFTARTLKCGKKDFIGSAKAIFPFRCCDRLGEITVPTLVMAGEHDEIEPVQYSEQIHGLIKGSTLKIIKNSGHCVLVEQPERTNEELLSFLKSID
ncbi:MAG: alpha/beta fold hydrolase [Candidatus Thorarchaeota archaeon]